ncbi:hypothetical protein CWO91_35515 [Bradyrhizobium genosp. SA-3]|uniref:hypothetical protein n=1 Tax=Bradyrhizobium genosp. SA-3 TaxID=508868 RepID=UPI001029443A|nr:hypothetical protein [Bradyrhizobium genosp. SA-3]RZM99580.1 hypothetical protein CWO91_35515 [Bradyrhizobium genosp. SA-3]
MTVKVPVSIAAHVVAAGIYGDRARLTLSLAPVFNEQNTQYDLADWPNSVEKLLASSEGFEIIALGKDQSWRTQAIFAAGNIKKIAKKDLHRIGSAGEAAAITAYWRSVMGDDDGFGFLAKALDPAFDSQLRDPLDAALRDPEKAGPYKTPDIHGTSRDKVVKELTLERAAYFAAGLRRETIDTRPKPKPSDSLSFRIKDWKTNRIGPWPSDVPLRDSLVAALSEDDQAYLLLQDSRTRADNFAAARRIYQDTGKTPKEAIDALTAAHPWLLDRTPLDATLYFSDPRNFTDTGKKHTRAIMTEAAAAYRLASRTPTFDGKDVLPPADDPRIEFARRRLFTLQGNPSLGRLFRFAVDFDCPVKALKDATDEAFLYPEKVLDRDPAGPDDLPEPAEQYARFLLLRLATMDDGSRLWSCAKLRLPGKETKSMAGHFLPCAREEIDARVVNNDSDGRELAVFGQIDGIVDLGQHVLFEQRYQIISLDPIMGMAADDAKEKRRAEDSNTLAKYSTTLLPQVRDELADNRQGTQRGGGLALTDRWRQLYGIERHLDSRDQRSQYDPKVKNSKDIVLDASDLTVGYKLDVGVRGKGGRNRWHTLMHRKVEYTPTKNVPAKLSEKLNDYITKLYPNSAARLDADDGQLQSPAALRDWLPEGGERKHTSAFMEEVIGAWRGDPLGLACGVESHPLSTNDLRIDISYDLPTEPAATPPPLRFGWRYHFGLRAFFAGGVSLPLNRTLGHYEKSRTGQLVLPVAGDYGTAFLRHERIEAPVMTIPDWMFGALKRETNYTRVALKGRFPVPQAGRMMVRSLNDPSNRRIADISGDQSSLPGIGFDRRVLMAPPVPLEFAALHDAFRGKSGEYIERKVKMCDPRVLQGDRPNPNDYETSTVDGEEEKPEFVPVPDPANAGRAIWKKVRVAWRPHTIESRPRGGLKGVDHRAAWGGFPVYRAKASAGLTKPKEKAPVMRPAAITDEGEILYRVKGDGEVVFKGQPNERKIFWSAVGVFENEDGQSDRSGVTVFRPLPTDRDKEIERQPYYPDPAAVTLVIDVAVRGTGFDGDGAQRHAVKSLPLYTTDELKGPAPPDYPDAIPVVLDLVRGDGKGELIKFNGKSDYGKIPNTPPSGRPIAVAHVTVTLAPGEEARIRCWCVPSAIFLTHMWGANESLVALAVARGFVETMTRKAVTEAGITALSYFVDDVFETGLKRLTTIDLGANKKNGKSDGKITFAGLPMPAFERMLTLADEIRKRMLQEPMPLIAAVTEIEAVHAVDLPKQVPSAVAGRKWQLLRVTGKTNNTENIDLLLKPEKECELVLGALCKSDDWTLENQMADAVDVLLDGSLTVHGPTTGAVEIRASGTAAARGRFDDVERGRTRDDRARGLWPKPDAQEPMKAKRLFGFEPADDGSVSFEPESITLLRIEGFAPGPNTASPGEVRLDLLDLQRQAKALEPRPGQEIKAHDPPLRAFRPTAFPDTRARWIELSAVAISRHTGALRTRYDELPEVLTKPGTQPGATEAEKKEVTIAVMDRRWLPATRRPARVVSLSPIPAFAWNDNVPTPANAKVSPVFVSRAVRVRVRAKRAWLSAGEGERLGVVIWPPNLFAKDLGNLRHDIVRPLPDDRNEINLRTLPDDGSKIVELQDADLGPGGGWVTRWGADPIRSYSGLQGWLLSKENFPGVSEDAVFTEAPEKHPKGPVLVKNVLMPVPADADAAELRAAQPPGGFMAVSLITYAPRFDVDQETWYFDLELNPCGAVYPFVRLGLVRFQPNAPRALQVSEPIVEWAQVMPERKLNATARYVDPERKRIEITAVVEGISSGADDNEGHPELSAAQAPRMYFSLIRRRLPRGDELPDSEVVYDGPRATDAGCSSACMTWTTAFRIHSDEYQSHNWSVFAEEVDRLRPATYPDEPRYETHKDSNFADTGPRFTARLGLDNLKIT